MRRERRREGWAGPTRQKKTEVTDIGNRFSRDRPTGFMCLGRRVNDDASLRSRTFIRYADRLIYRHSYGSRLIVSLSLSLFLLFFFYRAPDRVKISSRAKHRNFSVAGGAFPCAQLALLFSSSPIIDAPRSPPREKFGGKNILPHAPANERKKVDANNPRES